MSRRAPRAGGRTAPAFGRWLKECRAAFGKRNSYEEIERQLREAGGHFITSSTLQRYETLGRVPDALTIKALADLYGFDFSAAMLMLARELENPTSVLDGKAETGVDLAATERGGAHGAEALELRAEIKHLRREISSNADLLRTITDRLETLAASSTTHGRVPRSGTGKSKRR